MLAVQILGAVLVLFGMYVVVANALSVEGHVKLLGLEMRLPASAMVLVLGVAVFLFPFSPWWPEPDGIPDTPDSPETQGSPETPAVQRYQVEVAADDPWTDTGVDLLPGDAVTITASGSIRDDVNGNPDRSFPPDGVPDIAGEHPGDPFSGMNHAALVGRVGEDGEPFEVGSQHDFMAERVGRLFLGINDGRFDDNDGAYDAEITVTRA